MAWFALAACRAGFGHAALDDVLRQAAYLVTFGAASVAAGRAGLHRFSVLLLTAFVIVGGYAMIQKLGLDPVEEFRTWHSESRVFSTFGNPDFLGAWLALLLPLALGLSPVTRRFIAVPVMAVLWLTGSRGAMLGALAGGTMWLSLSRSWRTVFSPGGRSKLLEVAAAVGVLLAAAGASRMLTRRTDRLMLWAGTARMIRTAPVTGWGVGRFASEFYAYAPPAFAARMTADNTFAEHPHSEYLHVAVEAGLPGLGMFVWLLTAILATGIARARRGDPLAAAAVGSLAAILVHIAVDRNFRLASTGIPFWLLAGALVSSAPSPKVPGTFFNRSLTFAAGAAGLALAALLLRPLLASYRVEGQTDFLKQAAEFSSAQLEAEKNARAGDPQFQIALGNAYAKEGKFPKAVTSFAEALRLDPRSTAAANNLGNSWFMMSNFDQAIAAYRKVLALDPPNKDARFNLAFALFHQRKIKDALAECDILLRMDPQNAKALQLRAQLAP